MPMRPELWQSLTHRVKELDAEHDSLYLLLDGAALPALQLIYQHDDAPMAEPLYRGTL